MMENKAENKLDFSLISKYRAILMGVAIIMIMFCHLDVAQARNGMDKTRLANLLHTFTVGVDIFVFLSGFGLYYSYSKKRQTYLSFAKRRLLRVLPLYFIIGGITYFLYDLVIQHLGIWKFIRDILFISWFRDGSTRYWFIFAISVFYLLFPLLYRIICFGKYGAAKTVAFCLFWWTVTELLFLRWNGMAAFRMPLARLPMFVIGIYCGKLSKNKKEVKKIPVVFVFLFGLISFIASKRWIPKAYNMQLYYPIRGALGTSIMIAVIAFMEGMHQLFPRIYSALYSVLAWVGGLTLELYLLHQSYLILFEFPCSVGSYLAAAVLMPIVSASVYYSVKLWIKRQRE